MRYRIEHDDPWRRGRRESQGSRLRGRKSLHLGHRDSLVYRSRTRTAEAVAVLGVRSPLTDSNRRPLLTMRSLRQRVATDGDGFACFRGFPAGPISERLPPVATTGLHKGSILS